jgi:hypothetical protein
MQYYSDAKWNPGAKIHVEDLNPPSLRPQKSKNQKIKKSKNQKITFINVYRIESSLVAIQNFKRRLNLELT